MILIVTADWFREKILTESLGEMAVQICRDAYSALDCLEQAKVIFLDADLPAVNGVAFVHELASYADTAKIPIVLLADQMPEIDFAVYNIDSVLTVRDLVPDKLLQMARRLTEEADARR
ncbi:hypothetical protein FWG76_02610 [Candidatus Saccharibacteria bacterium]|nr:hypothetical protein [Candidatus Saccharibacteria bacterium]